ncbi:MAG: hypothetical protein WCO60_07175 [Verrucomicrobiota bacterium]
MSKIDAYNAIATRARSEKEAKTLLTQIENLSRTAHSIRNRGSGVSVTERYLYEANMKLSEGDAAPDISLDTFIKMTLEYGSEKSVTSLLQKSVSEIYSALPDEISKENNQEKWNKIKNRNELSLGSIGVWNAIIEITRTFNETARSIPFNQTRQTHLRKLFHSRVDEKRCSFRDGLNAILKVNSQRRDRQEAAFHELLNCYSGEVIWHIQHPEYGILPEILHYPSEPTIQALWIDIQLFHEISDFDAKSFTAGNLPKAICELREAILSACEDSQTVSAYKEVTDFCEQLTTEVNRAIDLVRKQEKEHPFKAPNSDEGHYSTERMAELNKSAQQKRKEFKIHKAELNTKITTFFNKMTSPWAETIYLFYEHQGFSEAEITHFSIKRREYIHKKWISGQDKSSTDTSTKNSGTPDSGAS